jgi:iron(III) transport system substrate-binding protein
MAHPATSGTSYTVLATLVQARGKTKAIEYFKALNKNLAHYTKSGTTPPLEVAKGEGAIAITFSHDGLKPAADGSPIELSFPKEGTGFEVGCVALIKGGPDKETQAAKRFIDWSISKRGQELFEKSRSFRLPVNRQAEPPRGAIKVSNMRLIAYDAVWAGENRATLAELFTKEVSASDNLK